MQPGMLLVACVLGLTLTLTVESSQRVKKSSTVNFSASLKRPRAASTRVEYNVSVDGGDPGKPPSFVIHVSLYVGKMRGRTIVGTWRVRDKRSHADLRIGRYCSGHTLRSAYDRFTLPQDGQYSG
jgi:hypothetical protein